MRTRIKYWIWALVLFCACGVSRGETYYRAGEGVRKEWLNVPEAWEVSVGWKGRFLRLEDYGKANASGVESGVSGRMVYYVTPWLGLGVEGSIFEEEDFLAGVTLYKLKGLGALCKVVTGRETRPRSYLVGVYGREREEVSYEFDWREKRERSYGGVGFGLETDVYGAVSAGVEARGIWREGRRLGSYYKRRSEWELETMVWVGIRF